MSYLLAALLLLPIVIPFPIYWIFTVVIIPLYFLAALQALIAFFSHTSAQKNPEFYRVFIGSIVTLPFSLLFGLFITIPDNSATWEVWAIVLHVFVGALAILGGFVVGRRMFPKKESFKDRALYHSNVIRAVAIAFIIITAYWAFIQMYPEINPSHYLAKFGS